MYPSILALALCVGQVPGAQGNDSHEFLGKVETINKNTGGIGIRSSNSDVRRMFYVDKRTQITKDGAESASFSDVRPFDVVHVTWKMRRDPVLEDKRMVQKVDIRPTLWPDKLKVGQIGYLPPQNERYHYFVEAVPDKHTVLIREVVLVTPESQGYRSSNPNVRIRKDGEQFFLGNVNADDYPLGKKVEIDGKWRVKGAKSASVTKAGAVRTTKTTDSRTTQSEQQTGIKTEGQGDEDLTVNGSTTERSLKGKRNTDQNVKDKIASKGTDVRTEQHEETLTISGFMLVPLEKERE